MSARATRRMSSTAHEPTHPASAAPPSGRAGSRPTARALVVGASSGIGAALVRQLAREGWSVAGLARRAERLDELARSCAGDAERSGAVVRVHAHDVTRSEEVPALFEEVVRELGGLDLLIYAAGIMPAVGRDEYDTEKDLSILAVNLGGCIAWGNAAARLFRTQRRGTLVGVSSIAGVRGRKGQPVYGTSKAAMDHYLEALRNRLAEVGVRVCTIRPGYVETPMTEGLPLKGAISPEEAARAILAAARGGSDVRYVPRRWGAVAAVVRNIPSFVFKHLNI